MPRKVIIIIIIVIILAIVGLALGLGLYFGLKKDPVIVRLREVVCVNEAGNIEVDYGIGENYTCRAGKKSTVRDSDVHIFSPDSGQPANTLPLWMVTVAGAGPNYILSATEPVKGAVKLGYAWPPSRAGLAGTKELRINNATINGAVASYLTVRPVEDAKKYGWSATNVIAVVPVSTDIKPFEKIL